jgi:hypothetical protein
MPNTWLGSGLTVDAYELEEVEVDWVVGHECSMFDAKLTPNFIPLVRGEL